MEKLCASVSLRRCPALSQLFFVSETQRTFDNKGQRPFKIKTIYWQTFTATYHRSARRCCSRCAADIQSFTDLLIFRWTFFFDRGGRQWCCHRAFVRHWRQWAHIWQTLGNIEAMHYVKTLCSIKLCDILQCALDCLVLCDEVQYLARSQSFEAVPQCLELVFAVDYCQFQLVQQHNVLSKLVEVVANFFRRCRVQICRAHVFIDMYMYLLYLGRRMEYASLGAVTIIIVREKTIPKICSNKFKPHQLYTNLFPAHPGPVQ